MFLSSSSRTLLFYVLPYVVSGLLYFCFSEHDLVGNSSALLYGINLSSIVLTLGGCYLALSLEKIPFVRNRLSCQPPSSQRRAVHFLTSAKIGIFAFLLPFNTLLYSVAAYSDAPKYCVLISIILGIFVFPRLHIPSQSDES